MIGDEIYKFAKRAMASDQSIIKNSLRETLQKIINF